MEKVNIVTINDNSNFGNRLQSYALAKYLRNNNVKVNVIWESSLKDRIINSIKLFIPLNKEIRRFNNFNRFTMFNIKVKVTKNNEILSGKYIVGSDQVWNPTLENFNKKFLLEKVPNEERISYAASFGINEIPNDYCKIFSDELSKFKYISVREEIGKEIVKKLTGRNDAEVLIDPTLLLDSKEWEKIIKKPKMFDNQKFIFCYFLGEISEKVYREINKIAKENNCKIINILDKNDKFYECGPREFLFLEKNAFAVCTDSYHSSIFAMIFNTPFIIFDRKDKLVKMNSRLDTLINKFKLENRKFNNEHITEENLNSNYVHVNEILEKERKKSHNYLMNALDLSNGEKNGK